MSEIYPLRPHRMENKDKPSGSFQQLNRRAVELAKSCERAEMPSLDHLLKSDYEQVYEPSDDTFLLLDALNVDFGHLTPDLDESKHISKSDNHPTVTTLEIGAGTGVATVFLAKSLARNKLFSSHERYHYVTDINPHAIQITLETAARNKNKHLHNNDDTVDTLSKEEFQIEAIQCDLASSLLPKLTGQVDILLFNPPYVPTPDSEVGGTGIEASWAGGENGRIVIDRALPQIARLLSWPNGVAYVVTVDENLPQEIAKIMFETYGITVTPFVRRKAWNEFLTIQKLALTRELRFD